MGFLDWLFGDSKPKRYLPATRRRERAKPKATPAQMEIARSAENLARIITESIEIAQKSANIDTIKSRVELARNTYFKLDMMLLQHDFLTVGGMQEADAEISELENSLSRDWARLAESNTEGERLEKAGEPEAAIKVYEALAAEKVDTPHTYRRLAILHRKAKRRDDEIRCIRLGIEAIPESNSKHRQWLINRLAKLEKKS